MTQDVSARSRLGWSVAVLLLAVIATGVVTIDAQQPQAGAGTRVDGELLVQYRPGAQAGARARTRGGARAALIDHFEALGIDHVRVTPGTEASAIAALRRDADVVLAEPNYTRQAVAVGPPNDPYWLSDALWGLQRILAQPAWTNFPISSTVVVADIDTGVNYAHPDLAASMWRNPGEVPANGVDDDGNGYVDDVYGIDTYNRDSDPMDDHGHGTHTAGTIAAAGNNGIGVVGVNSGARILACKFLDASGNGSDAGAIACFNYVAALRSRGVNVRVTSNSWGAPRSGSVPTTLKAAIDALGNAGVVNVFSAGNNGMNIDSTPFDPASLTSSSIVSVAASDQSDNRAGFSNYGAVAVDLAAPGVSILSTYGGGYASSSGTSMAAPHVAGAASFVAALQPGVTVAGIKAALLDGVDRLGNWNGVVQTGGRLNLLGTVLATHVNMPPAVTIISPATSAIIIANTPVSVSATATDSDGTVASVAFFADGVSIGIDTSAPYTANWSSVTLGAHVFTATVTDNLGATTSAAAVSVSIANASASPDGATVPPSSQIIDAQGAIWTIGPGQRILRNGVQAGSGLGSVLLWYSGSVYTLGVDANWWRWSGAAWNNFGSTPPYAATSPDGTLLPPAAQITDAQGHAWTLDANRRVLRDGVQAAGGLGTKLLWLTGTIYTLGVDNNWWRWSGSAWINIGPTMPGGASADGTVVPPASQIVDAQGAVWSIGANQRILVNGVQAAGGLGTKLLWYRGVIYVLGVDSNWWQWGEEGWLNVGPVEPSTPSNSSDGTQVPPADQIIDSTGAVWRLGSNQFVLRNGVQAAYGLGSRIVWSRGVIYVFGVDSNWWRWIETGWANVGPAQPF